MLTLSSYRALTPHAHNSKNTHLIVQGELTIWNIKELRKYGPYKVGESPTVEANTCYRAEAGAEGCIFIEGHKDLSPTSAKRFEDLGTITKTPVGDMTDNGKEPPPCTHGRCHLSNGRWYHMCVEFGKGPSKNEVCDVKEQMQGGKPSR